MTCRIITEFDENIVVRYEVKLPDHDIDRIDFEHNQALALLLIKEVVSINRFWWEKDWPEECRQLTGFFVNCNDVFAWACSDSEPMYYKDIQEVFEHWEKDPDYGAQVWCIKRRNMMPQKPVYDYIQKRGIWDLDSMFLKPNPLWPK